MNRFPFVLIIVLVLGGIGGCGGSDKTKLKLLPVAGTVSRKNKPLTDADLTFIPIENTTGKGGRGRSDAAGEFTVTYTGGGEGLPAGKYRVAVSRRLMPDGSPVPADDTTEPIESPARETLPKDFTDIEQSPLTVIIAADTPIAVNLDR